MYNKKIMKLFLTSLLLAGLCFNTRAQDSTAAAKARSLPAVDVKTTDGASVTTTSFSNQGKPIVICFWATWCKPCVEELNTISELYDDWKKETGVKIIAVSVDDAKTMNRVGPFVNGRNWDYEVYIDPNGDFRRAMNVNMPPHTFLLNGKGEIIWQHVSYTPGDEQKLYEAVKMAAGGKEKIKE